MYQNWFWLKFYRQRRIDSFKNEYMNERTIVCFDEKIFMLCSNMQGEPNLPTIYGTISICLMSCLLSHLEGSIFNAVCIKHARPLTDDAIFSPTRILSRQFFPVRPTVWRTFCLYVRFLSSSLFSSSRIGTSSLAAAASRSIRRSESVSSVFDRV